MLVNATFVPDTALLVPGAAGAADVLVDVRRAALAAVRALLADAPARLVVVAPGTADRMRPGPFTPTLAAAGIDDGALGWTAPPAPSEVAPSPVTSPASAAGLLLLAHAGWAGPTTLVEVTPPSGEGWTRAAGRAAELAALGHGVTAGPDRVGMLVAGSLSARRGPDAPLAQDGRADPVDDGMLVDLADAGPDARARLAAMSPELAGELAVTAWAPWQVAVGAVPRRAEVRAAVHRVAAPFGLAYVVASWHAS